jgi:hypothetical protein
LLPSSVTRQAILLVDGFNQAVDSPIVTYDPVTLTVTLSNPAKTGPWLKAGQPYKVILPTPEESKTGLVLRAIDGAPLASDQTRVLGFLGSSAFDQPNEPTMQFCADVLPIFHTKCSGTKICHVTPDNGAFPLAGMDLETADGVRFTAIGRVAQGSNTGARAGLGSNPGKVFGVDMPIIDPGNPGNSWIVYKTMLAAYPTIAATGRPDQCGFGGPTDLMIPDAGHVDVADSERIILGDYVGGRQMPYPPADAAAPDYSTQPLTFEERERLRLWIAQGANVEACSTCGN